MARYISDILEAREPDFSQQITELEKISGRPGVDVRLVGDLIQARKKILNSLGLDDTDTKPAELYYALSEKALADSRLLAVKIRIEPNDKPEVAVNKSIAYVRKISGNNNLWTLRSSTAKKQIKENPPKKLMKIFSLRSVDSALKREPLSLLFTFAKKIEAKLWQDKYTTQASRLNPTDFDYQNIEISQVPALRQGQLKKADVNLNQIVYVNYDVAGIVIITPKKRFDGDVLFLIHSILQNIKLLKSASLYMKLHSMETDFPNRLETLRRHGFNNEARNYKTFGWNAYSKHLGSLPSQEIDGLEFAGEDDFKTVDTTQLLEDGSTWQHHFLLAPGENFIISCNLSDVILNAVNNYEPEEAHYIFGQRELRDELFGRYVQLPEIREFLNSEAGND